MALPNVAGAAEPSKRGGHGLTTSWSRSLVLPHPTDDLPTLHRAGERLLALWGGPPSELRGLGLQLKRLLPSAPAGGSVATMFRAAAALQAAAGRTLRIESAIPTRYGT